MKEPKKLSGREVLFVLLGVALVWALVSIVSSYIVPTVEGRDTVRSEKALVGATLAPEATPVTRVSLGDDQAAGPVAAATLVPSDDLPRDMPQLLQDYVYLYAVNSDMGGWIRVRAIPRIDFAWVRGKNAYYIHKDFYGRENAGGTAFLDECCTDWPRDDNLIIFAHNLKSGDMFGELNRLTDASVLKANPLIDFDTLYEKGVYVPVAVLVCDINPGSAAYFDFNVSTLSTKEAFDAYIGRAKALNLVRCGADARFGDKLLTLVTCYDDANQQRLLVIARALRESETEERVISAFFH